jgi:chromosomal replication initiator protein
VVNGVVTIPLRGQPLRDAAESDDGVGCHPAADGFVVGPENGLAVVAIRSILGGAPNGYNPVVVYGPSGVGKSHLVCGLAAQWQSIYRRRAVCVTAVDFARELADSIETQSVDEFQAKYRQAALLVVEDLGGLVQGKTGKLCAQDELVHTLDCLAEAGGWIVVTASLAPGELPGVAPRLQSRLVAGLTVPLLPPGSEARLALLQRLADVQGISLPGPVAQILADGLPLTAPELRGALLQLEVRARAEGCPIDAALARGFLTQRVTLKQQPLREIAAVTARHFALKLSDLRSPSRRRALVTARGVAMYLARSLTRLSLEQIGKYFGGRDHTTVMYSCDKTAELLKSDPAIRHAVETLRQQWQTI